MALPFRKQFFFGNLLLFFFFLAIIATLQAESAATLPLWATDQQGQVLRLQLPQDLQTTPKREQGLKYLILEVAPDWAPDWKQAAFQLKAQIVALKTAGPEVLVGLQASEAQIHQLLAFELAPYIDGYLYHEVPFLPEEDPTGKLWFRLKVPARQVLRELIEASSLGVQLVLFEDILIDEPHQAFLETIRNAKTGSLDNQPQLSGVPVEEAAFFYTPVNGFYQLAVYGNSEQETRLSFVMEKGVKATAIFPNTIKISQRNFGARLELVLSPSDYYFLQLEPPVAEHVDQQIEIVRKAAVDPYELVVKNQVFKKAESDKFQSLRVTESQDLRYQSPNGGEITISYLDTIFARKDLPIERVRREMYLMGVKWPYDELPDLPLIQPEKVQHEPLVIDLNRSYDYEYQGEETLSGRATWKVGFKPKEQGKFYTGVVWIDQETGAHRKVRAFQRELDPPVIANEITVYYDWVEDQGTRYWAQVREANLQVINVAGLTLPLQIDSVRKDYSFNQPNLDQELAQIYSSDALILRDTAKGYRYLKKRGGEREIAENTLNRSRALLGGVLYDPAMDSPIPLFGFNYTSFDFRKSGFQANFFIAGAVNDLILSNPNFLGKGWDLTAEAFLSPLYFPDTLYQNREKVDALEIEQLHESFFLTLGIPLGSYFKTTYSLSTGYNAYKKSDETDPNFILPSNHVENKGSFNLLFNRRRISSDLQFDFVRRSKWEAWGLPDSLEPLQESYRKLSWNMSYSKPLPKMQTLRADLRVLEGWDLDRFSRFGFGFFENSVSGFGTSGIEATRAVRMRMGYEVGVAGLAQITMRLDGARAWNNQDLLDGSKLNAEPVDLYGVGLGINFIAPWKLLMRAQLGYGLHSDLPEEAGHLNGQILFLRLF